MDKRKARQITAELIAAVRKHRDSAYIMGHELRGNRPICRRSGESPAAGVDYSS